MNVAFLGLGTMGAPMASNIARKGHAVTAWNRTPKILDGLRTAATPAEAARGADVVILMLADPAAVDAVAGELAPALAPGAILVDMSTVDPECARRTAALAAARGARYLDAPVSGTRGPAEQGALLIMAGGDDETLAAARPVLECMGRVKHMGPVGHGMAMKLVLNGLGAHMLTGFCAVLGLGARQGLDAHAMLDVIAGGAFSSPLWTIKGPKIFSRDFTADFTLALMRKDQRLVLETARALGYEMPTEQAIYEVLGQAVEAGFGDGDLCGLVRLFEQWAGTTVGTK
jgi:3-hydroxyisobutyrate dehydrogenase-like beta-hydroxyacid dehydrogenase